ncbi:MAG: acyltransferase family protein [Gammaproteobacteria bacterium]|nr:acyltransferase family protein [Gammaproteobacteria bacterium]
MPRKQSIFFYGGFFFISALFVVSSHKKKGTGLFILDKFKRLGIPTLIWLIVILPLLSLLVSSNYALKNIIGFFHTGQIDLGVTWFCWALIVFNLVWLSVLKLTSKEDIEVKSMPIPSLWRV